MQCLFFEGGGGGMPIKILKTKGLGSMVQGTR